VPEVDLDFPRQWVEFVDPADEEQIFRCDLTWLLSRWTCIFGNGCKGILADRPNDGCCSHGAYFSDKDDEKRVKRFAKELTAEEWQFRKEGRKVGVTELEDGKRRTRKVDDACIFLNRPGFAGGAGCALHLEAIAAGESPIEWKPSVCWQLPIKVDWELTEGGAEVATVRGWTRADWGGDGETMAWCCTEGTRAYVGDVAVVDSLAHELQAIVGTEVYVTLRSRLPAQ
jgi:hypothetical protein